MIVGAQKGNATIQVLRSAPASMISAETKSNRGLEPTPGTQDDIHHAMVELIKKASRFIYIENQFFVSDFGALGESTPAGLSPAAQAIQAGIGSEPSRAPERKVVSTSSLRNHS